MEIKPLSIEGSYLITPRTFSDERGSFSTLYDVSEFARNGLVADWLADNQSYNVSRGTLRGLHFQRAPYAQSKLVRAAAGRIFDVFVDLRKDSATFMKWEAVELDSRINNSVFIPKGCAHGYLTLDDHVVVCYKVDANYSPASEGGLAWNDPSIGIKWLFTDGLILSVKDIGWPQFDAALHSL